MSDKKGENGQLGDANGQFGEMDQVFRELTEYVQKPYDSYAEHYYKSNARGGLIQAIDLLKSNISVLKHNLRSVVAMLKNDLRDAKATNTKLRNNLVKARKEVIALTKKVKSMEGSKVRAKRKEQKRYFHQGPMRPMSREDIVAMDKEARVGIGLHGKDD